MAGGGSSDRLEALEQQLELFIENTRSLGIIVSDFQPSGQAVLNQKLHTMVTGMQEMDRLRAHVQDVMIPIEVFDYIDSGKNPQLYTKECMEKALDKNEEVKGKIDSLRKFKTLLMLELSKIFPNEIAKYRQLRSDDRPLNLDR